MAYTGESEEDREAVDKALRQTGKPYTLKQMKYNFASNVDDLVNDYAASDAVLLLNDDVELTEDALGPCLQALANPQVGTVGIMLLYPDNTIQHAGQYIVEHDGKFAKVGHLMQRYPRQEFKGNAEVVGNTGAFMMTRLQTWKAVGGMDEGYKHCLEDVQFNLQCRMMGLRNWCLLPVKAYHAESVTRHQAMCREDIVKIVTFYNVNRDKFGQAGIYKI